jgi:EmrB/QacA subfamily drug resistance transporter
VAAELTSAPSGQAGPAGKAATLVLAVLASSQFLMTLDSSVMNVSMADVAADLNTSITGIQTAITLYTLVMATLMITGGKLGTIIGRRRAYALGLSIYGVGALITSLAPSLPVLLLGWSVLEGMGAALIMPAVVALVASNFPPERRAAAYGLLAAACAMAVAAGPLIGGAVTTFASWRYVFAGEVVVVVVILASLHKMADVPPVKARLDVVGSALSILGLGMFVFGVLRSTQWGWTSPNPGAPSLMGASPVIWLIVAGMGVSYLFLLWETHLSARGGEPLVHPSMLRNRQLSGGLGLFFFQFLVQGGVFFAVPLLLTIVLGLDPLQTGVRILPLSMALLLAAAGIPKVAPHASPRLVVRLGILGMLAGIVVLAAGLSPAANAGVVAVPMLLMGLGLGAIASQLGAATVSAVPDTQSAEVGGLQNTATNLGSSLGTALIGSILIAALSSAVLAGVQASPTLPASVKSQASVELVGSLPFLSDAQLTTALAKAGVTGSDATVFVNVNAAARLEGLRAAFWVAALLTLMSLFLTGRLPRRPVGEKPGPDEDE